MEPVEEEGEDLGDSDISDDDYLMGYGEEDPDDYYHMDNMDQDYQNQVRWESLLWSAHQNLGPLFELSQILAPRNVEKAVLISAFRKHLQQRSGRLRRRSLLIRSRDRIRECENNDLNDLDNWLESGSKLKKGLYFSKSEDRVPGHLDS